MKSILKGKQKLIAAVLVAVLAISCLYTMTLAAQPSAAAGEATGRAAAGFQDVPDHAYYFQAVAYCQENSLISGTGMGTFSPNMKLSRGMLVTILWRNEGEPSAAASNFTDVKSGSYYETAIGWAAKSGIADGYDNNRFGPEDNIERQQLAAMLYRYAELKGEDMAVSTPQAFADDDKISDYAKTSVAWAREKGIISGKGGNHFDPLGNATRAEAAAMVYRYLTKDANPVAPTPSPSVSPVPQPGGDEPVVYMTTDISSHGLMEIYKALNWNPTGKVAVKISTGESQNTNHLRPELIDDLVQSVNGTIVECNTAYGGSRSSTAAHKQAAEDRGYTAIAEVDIMDEEGSMTLPVAGGDNLTENYVGAHFANYDSFLVLSHFKGHAMAGYGGAIKNISIGIASSEGKAHIHSGGTGGSMWGGDQDAFLESMAEAGKSVVTALDGKIVYINVMNRLSVDCDCDANPAQPDMHDIGILASYDPVALDQACIDLVYRASDGQNLRNRIESRNGLHTLEQAAKIGLGSREYELKSID